MMKKVLASLLFIGSFTGILVPAAIHAEEIIGEENADIQVNGSLGLDNTDPSEDIEEGNDSWINVTVDTATIFYNVNGRTDIQSPTYNISNNSGRPVDVSVADFVQTNSESIAEISTLNLTSPAATSDEILISNGTLINFGSPVHLFTLANNEGKLTSDGEATNPFATTFGYNGTLSSSSVTKSSPIFTMTLQLDAVSWTTP